MLAKRVVSIVLILSDVRTLICLKIMSVSAGQVLLIMIPILSFIKLSHAPVQDTPPWKDTKQSSASSSSCSAGASKFDCWEVLCTISCSSCLVLFIFCAVPKERNRHLVILIWTSISSTWNNLAGRLCNFRKIHNLTSELHIKSHLKTDFTLIA